MANRFERRPGNEQNGIEGYVFAMNQYNPKVSIVIPAYNASNYLAEAIESALAQTYENIEIIVVNDGSKDDGATAEAAQRYQGKIRYFEKENGGSSSALNCGIRNMSGEWFSWLSHDDLYYPEKVAEQISYIRQLGLEERELKRHVFFSASDLIDANGNVIRRANPEKAQFMAEHLKQLPGNEYLVCEPTRYQFHGCSCLLHKDAFAEVGTFDESLRLLNDVDLWFRLYSQGFVVHYIPKPLVQGRIHAKQVSRSIGFSYHNPEQDWFWDRSLQWLKSNCPDNYELFWLFGRNAFLKTRNEDAEKAFAIAKQLKPGKAIKLTVCKLFYMLRAAVRSMGKKLYLALRA